MADRAAARAREYAARREARAGLAAVRERQPADLLTVQAVAQRLDVSPDTVYLLVQKREIACVRVGTGTRRPRLKFTEAQVTEYIARYTVPAAPAETRPVTVRQRAPRRSLVDICGPEAGRYA